MKGIQVMSVVSKDAEKKRELKRKYRVLRQEREAAGVMKLGGYSFAFFGGLPRFFFVLDSAASPLVPPSPVSGLGIFGGRPRFRLGNGSSVPGSSFLSWRGRGRSCKVG
jgi:hypothetical protein